MLLATGGSNVLDIPLFVAAARDGAPASASRLHKEAAAGRVILWRPPLVTHRKRQLDCEARAGRALEFDYSQSNCVFSIALKQLQLNVNFPSYFLT